MDFLCVTVPNYFVNLGCWCFAFVQLLFTMFPTIDQITATVPGGVFFVYICVFCGHSVLLFLQWLWLCFWLIVLDLSSFFFSYVIINYYLFWPYFHYICLLLNLFLIIYSAVTFVRQYFRQGLLFDCLDLACTLVVGCCMVCSVFVYCFFLSWVTSGVLSFSILVWYHNLLLLFLELTDWNDWYNLQWVLWLDYICC